MVNSEIMNANREYIIAVQTQHFVLCRSYLRVIFFCVCQKRLFCTIRRATYVSINPQLCSTMQTKHSLKSFFGCYMYFQDFLFSKYFIFKGFFVRIPFEAAHTKDVFQILLHAKQVEKSPWPIKRKSLCWALGTALEIYDPRTKFVVQTSNFHGSVFLLFLTSISGGVPKSGLSIISIP